MLLESSLELTLQEYYAERLRLHFFDEYMGIPLLKFPEDLRVLEHLISIASVQAVIEVGTAYGGSALWLRDRLATLRHYQAGPPPLVISIDLNQDRAVTALRAADPEFEKSIVLLEHDVCELDVAELVASHIPEEGTNILVIDDSEHSYRTTIASLKLLSKFVPPGGFFVVEDGHRDFPDLCIPEVRADGSRQVSTAIEDFLMSDAGSTFVVRRDMEIYGVTSNPAGYLQRRDGDARVHERSFLYGSGLRREVKAARSLRRQDQTD